MLLNCRADVHAKDGFSATALQWAAFSNNVEGVKVLCAAGCDPTAVNVIGHSPFTVAGAAGNVDVMKSLLPHTTKQELDNVLHAAMLQGGSSAEALSMLIDLGADASRVLLKEWFLASSQLALSLNLR